MRYQDDGHTLGGQFFQGGKQLLLLGQADAGGGLVEDQHARSKGEQAQDFQLLALAYGERIHESIGLN